VYHTLERGNRADDLMFYDSPYEASLVMFEDTTAWTNPGGWDERPGAGGDTAIVDPGTPTIPVDPGMPPLNITFSTGTSVYLANGVPVSFPFRIPTSGPGANSGYISARAFSAMVGLDDPVWDGARGVGTVSGRGVVVELTTDSFTANVNGNDVPITNSGGDPVPCINFDGFFYLPAAFISDVFGIRIHWDVPTGTVTFTD